MTPLFSIEATFNILVVVLSFIYWGVAFVIFYHLTRFGIGVQPKRFAAISLFGSIILFTASALLYANIDIKEFLQMI